MAIYRYGNYIPKIGKNSFISESATVIGNVTIGSGCYIGHGAIVRGDYGNIEIGDGSAIEEAAILHIRPNGLLKLENKVTVGHGALLHCSLVKSHAVIGIGAIVAFDAIIGKWSIVAESCTVTKGAVIPDETIVAGVPFKIIGKVGEAHKKFWNYAKQLYIDLAKEYPHKLERLD